jgi:hypothetical protein
MANGPKTPQQILAEYAKKNIESVDSFLQEKRVERRRYIPDITTKKSTPNISSVLRELKAKEELGSFLQAKEEKEQVGYGGTTVEFLKQKESDAKKEEEIREQKTKAEEAYLDEDIQVLEERIKKGMIRREEREEAYKPENIEMGQLPDFVLNNKPKKKLSIRDGADIPFFSNVFQEPKGGFSENNFYATPQKMQEFIDSGVLERNGIKLSKYDFNIVDVKVGDVIKKVIDINDTPKTREAFQQLMFDIFEKDAGIREFYNIDVKESFQDGDFILVDGRKFPIRTKMNTTPADSTRVE